MMIRIRLAMLGFLALVVPSVASAQITDPRILSAQGDPLATLEEQLINLLRATRDDQKAYIHHVVELVREGKLETRLVVAIERYAIRRNREYPFPYFERALRYEAAKRGVALPPVEHFASTRVVSHENDVPSSTKTSTVPRSSITIQP